MGGDIMQMLHYVKPHNIDKLRGELESAGVVILSLEHTDDEIWIGIPDDAPQQMIDAANTVVANHDPTPLPPPPTPDQQFKSALQALTSPTAADLKNALLTWLTNKGI